MSLQSVLIRACARGLLSFNLSDFSVAARAWRVIVAREEVQIG
jgi:hypothetical protein